VRCFLAPHRLRVSCCFGPACVVVCRALGRLSCLARVVVSHLFVLHGARGLSQSGVCRQRFVLRAQANSFVALPSIQSSAIVSLTDGATWLPSNQSFKRTAAPPLNSSVRWHVKLLGTSTQCSIPLLLVLGISACSSVPKIDGSSDAAFDRSHVRLVDSISPQDRMRLSLAELIVLAPLGCLSPKPIARQPFLTKSLGGQASLRSCRKELDGQTFKDIMSRAYPG
jgi:hypothetical protein